MDEIRTIIDFNFNDGTPLRTVTVNHTIPNMAVDQYMTFDHPSMTKSCSGKITKISHVVYLGNELPLTYVDVEAEDQIPQ